MSWMCESCVYHPEEGQPAPAMCETCNPEDPTQSNYQARRAYGADKYQDTAVLCPFYKHHDRKNVIICEGPMVRSSVTLRFFRRDEAHKHIRDYCELLYERCPLYKITMKKYETGE